MQKFAVVFFALIAFAVCADFLSLKPVGKRQVAPQDACDPNPCQSGQTCCVLSNGQAGCCPAANACCCPDKEHCCQSGYKCVCSGNSCTGCSSSGQCEPSSTLEF